MEYVIAIVVGLILLVLWVIFTVLLFGAIMSFLAGAMIFPRVAISIILSIGYTITIFDNNTLNYAVSAIVIFGILTLMGKFPRLNNAVLFASSMIVSVIAMYLGCFVIGVFGKTFFGFTNPGTSIFLEIALKAGCFGATLYSLYREIKKTGMVQQFVFMENRIAITIERALAACIYSVGSSIVIIPLQGLYSVPDVVNLIYFPIGVVVFFCLDWFLFGD